MKQSKVKPIMFLMAVITVFSTQAQTKATVQPQSLQPSMPVLSEATKALCKSAESLIEDHLKSIAYDSVAGITDNSAPRETNRQLKVVAATNQVQIQQLHMHSLHCPAIQWSISHTSYTAAAFGCSVASTSNDEFKEKCNRKNWSRSATKSD
jgi:hypothetical protein